MDLISTSVNGNSENLTNWVWSLDGNEINTGSSTATVTITNGGSHNIQLNVEASNYCMDSIITSIDFDSPPTVSLIIDNLCVGEELQINDNSTASVGSINDWLWSFENNTSSTDENPLGITYNTAGDYYVSLTITDDGNCSSSDSILVTVHPLPFVSFSTVPVCINEEANFPNDAGANNLIWDWNFGDGSGIVTGENSSHTFSAVNNYVVTLTNTTENGCVNTTTNTQVVTDCSSPLSFAYQEVCVGDTVFFEANISTNTGFDLLNFDWNWEFGDGSSSTDVLSAFHVYTSDQPFQVSLTVSDSFGNSFSYDQEVTCFPNPIVDFISDTPCLGCNMNFTNQSSILTDINWNWNFDDGNTSTLTNPSNQFQNEGTYTVTLTGITTQGCDGHFSQDIFLSTNPLIVEFISLNYCMGSVTNFNDLTTVTVGNNITSWFWNFGDGNSSNEQNPNHVYTSDGEFTVTLEVTSGTTMYSHSEQLIIDPAPVIDFSSEAVCVGDSVHLINSSTISSGFMKVGIGILRL